MPRGHLPTSSCPHRCGARHHGLPHDGPSSGAPAKVPKMAMAASNAAIPTCRSAAIKRANRTLSHVISRAARGLPGLSPNGPYGLSHIKATFIARGRSLGRLPYSFSLTSSCCPTSSRKYRGGAPYTRDYTVSSRRAVLSVLADRKRFPPSPLRGLPGQRRRNSHPERIAKRTHQQSFALVHKSMCFRHVLAAAAGGNPRTAIGECCRLAHDFWHELARSHTACARPRYLARREPARRRCLPGSSRTAGRHAACVTPLAARFDGVDVRAL